MRMVGNPWMVALGSVLLVFGSGHSYWLRHFVTEAPGFELVEPNDYLSALVGP